MKVVKISQYVAVNNYQLITIFYFKKTIVAMTNCEEVSANHCRQESMCSLLYPT